MRAIVLAGGHATRLWPITRHRAKPLLPLGEATILENLLDQVVGLADEVVVSTNALFEDDFREAVADVPDTTVAVEDQAREADKPGALGALFQLTEDLPEDEALLVVAGDNYYGFDLSRFTKAAQDRGGPTVAVKELPAREAASSFGVVELAGDTRIRAFHEKPEEPPSRLAATALYHYPVGWRALFDAYETVAREQENAEELFDAPGRVLEWAVEEGREVHAWSFEDPWFDIGTPSGYLDALEEVAGPRYVEGELVDCEAEEGVWVFGDARARDARLSSTVLLPGARVHDATLTRCIVDSQARVDGVDLEASLVGAHDRLQG